jgi:hypothetical protein
MSYQNEKELYPEVCAWLEGFLSQRYRNTEIIVRDTSRISLARCIEESGYYANLHPEWVSWDVRADVTAFLITPHSTKLVLVECKIQPITLLHLAQLIGYCRVVLPEHAFLISPKGISSSLSSLINTYERRDILNYLQHDSEIHRSIVIAGWNPQSKSLDSNSLITGDINYAGFL